MIKIIIFTAIILTASHTTEGSNNQRDIARVAPKIISMAHDFHGIKESIMDENDKCYFERNGQKCQLFTEAFLKYYKRGK